MKLEIAAALKRNAVVTLSIPAMFPIKTMNGVLHEGGQLYRVLGLVGTCVRLSRVSDCAKLIVNPEVLS